MFFKFFNWLSKRTPYVFAVNTIGILWGVISAGYGAFLIIKKANFQATGTGDIFVFTLILTIVFVILLKYLEYGALRFFGLRWEKKYIRIINDNVLKGRLRPDISIRALKDTYKYIEGLHKKLIYRQIQYTAFVIGSVFFVEWFASKELGNALVILGGGIIALIIYIIGSALLYEELIAPIRKDCKILLIKKESKKHFKEVPFLNLEIKSKIFILILTLSLLTILIVVGSLDITFIMFFISILVVFGLLGDLIFSSIRKSFLEIKDLAKSLELGKKAIFFTGSLDEEIIDLSKSLNKAANELYNAREKLEESSTILKIKVKARTRELRELTEKQETIIKKRTKKLQEKIKELERFQKLSVGRELKMIDLKKQIKKLLKK
ncbi:MAG TPA: hypothetical protein ENH06_01775 [bacterium]|nr:hypothetical protein [bacterium]